VEVELTSTRGIAARGIAPAGASKGSREAIDLRDGGPAYGGFGVSRALGNVNGPIAAAILGRDAADQEELDRALIELDGAPNKSRLGGNAMIATSMAALRLAAESEHLPLWRHLAAGAAVRLPLPEIQIFGGGAHAGGRIDIQDFLVIPVKAQSFAEALAMTADVYRAAGAQMSSRGRRYGVADEGGWWPAFDSNEEGLETLTRSIEAAGYGGGEVVISLDIAASEFYRDGRYRLSAEGRDFDPGDWLRVIAGWSSRFPIASIEDPFAEDDAEGMRAVTAALGDRVQIVGDDLLATNAARVRRAAEHAECNAALIKPNQAGTITETRQALEAARQAGFATILSARSGETEDVTIAHLAVGWNAGQLKVGSFARSERMAKWNELLRIEESLGSAAVFAGAAALSASRRPAP
jgi:enolase